MSQPIAESIDGSVAFDADRPLQAALADFYRAFNGRDLAAMERHWHSTESAEMSNPLGGIARGWPAIRAIYQRIFASPMQVKVAFHDYTLHEAADVFYAVGREAGTFQSAHGPQALAIRTSRVFRRIDGAWRQVHHHGSFEDAALLAAYQAAAR